MERSRRRKALIYFGLVDDPDKPISDDEKRRNDAEGKVFVALSVLFVVLLVVFTDRGAFGVVYQGVFLAVVATWAYGRWIYPRQHWRSGT